MIGNNCVLIRAGAGRHAYISHNTFNTMVTTNSNFCDETENWLKNLIRKSTPISGVSEKQRFRFFKMMNDKITRIQERIAVEAQFNVCSVRCALCSAFTEHSAQSTDHTFFKLKIE